jgi:hypothetical protein
MPSKTSTTSAKLNVSTTVRRASESLEPFARQYMKAHTAKLAQARLCAEAQARIAAAIGTAFGVRGEGWEATMPVIPGGANWEKIAAKVLADWTRQLAKIEKSLTPAQRRALEPPKLSTYEKHHRRPASRRFCFDVGGKKETHG